MWCNCLSKYLLNEVCVNDSISHCVFIKKIEISLTIITIYVNNLNLITILKGRLETTKYLNKEFKMKDLNKTRYCLGLQIKYFTL